jgi:hypothetical protein
MHYAEFAEDEVLCLNSIANIVHTKTMLTAAQSAALLAAIKEYEANKWKVIGQKVGKPAKASERSAAPIPILVVKLTAFRLANSMRKNTLEGRCNAHEHILHVFGLAVFAFEIPALIGNGALHLAICRQPVSGHELRGRFGLAPLLERHFRVPKTRSVWEGQRFIFSIAVLL